MRSKTISAALGETRRVAQNWTAECEARGTAVSASAWATTSGSLSGETLASNTASALLSVDGRGTLTNTATLANGETLIAWRRIEVEDGAAD